MNLELQFKIGKNESCQRKAKEVFPFKMYVFSILCACGGWGSSHLTLHKYRSGQLEEVHFLFRPCGSQGLNSGQQTGWQAPFLSEPSCQVKVIHVHAVRACLTQFIHFILILEGCQTALCQSG